MENKIKSHIERIKAKINIIKEHNKKLEEFNYKLESLLVSLDTFSLPPFTKKPVAPKEAVKFKLKNEENKNKKIQKMNIKEDSLKDGKIDLEAKKIINTTQHNKHTQYTPSKQAICELSNANTSLVFDSNFQSQLESSFNELVNRVIASSNPGKVNKMHIIKILGLLNSSKKGMFLDDVIKSSGMSKYKCIDVLNVLLKTEPPAITKKFDKGFIYFINL
ncbi:hypothetical protein NGRA_2107 [Nosema granulosis]|uniref:Uncharacterized protein n=1 Tax=Nosema granulosis TaxID=83296 RepID=A0A9P6KYR7_9MICR|nr:hypothetical protein NGRA_2107 [Nosema granulosis]